MVVRFLPPPVEAPEPQVGDDRENLAEVIQLRSRLNASSPESQAYVPGDGGAEVNESTLIERDGVRTAMDDAVRMLARRARSSGELRHELIALGHDAVDVDEVILECESRLYLDDLGLARVLTETLRERKRASRSQVRTKLHERRLPDGVIEEVLGELDDEEEHDLLREAANERARKMGGLDRQTAERRLLGFLARRGWSGERAIRVAREALDRDAQRAHSVLAPKQQRPSAARSVVRFH